MGINNTTARGLSLFGFLVHSVRFLRLVNWNYNAFLRMNGELKLKRYPAS